MDNFIRTQVDLILDKKLNEMDKYVAIALSYYSNNETNESFPSKRKLKDDFGISETNFNKYTKRLKEKGYIEIKQRFNSSNIYKLNFKGSIQTISHSILKSIGNSHKEVIFYCNLKLVASNDKKIMKEKNKLAKLLGMSYNTVKKHLNSLEKKGVITYSEYIEVNLISESVYNKQDEENNENVEIENKDELKEYVLLFYSLRDKQPTEKQIEDNIVYLNEGLPKTKKLSESEIKLVIGYMSKNSKISNLFKFKSYTAEAIAMNNIKDEKTAEGLIALYYNLIDQEINYSLIKSCSRKANEAIKAFKGDFDLLRKAIESLAGKGNPFDWIINESTTLKAKKNAPQKKTVKENPNHTDSVNIIPMIRDGLVGANKQSFKQLCEEYTTEQVQEVIVKIIIENKKFDTISPMEWLFARKIELNKSIYDEAKKHPLMKRFKEANIKYNELNDENRAVIDSFKSWVKKQKLSFGDK